MSSAVIGSKQRQSAADQDPDSCCSHPGMADYSKRSESFITSSYQLLEVSTQLATAGFFYTGDGHTYTANRPISVFMAKHCDTLLKACMTEVIREQI